VSSVNGWSVLDITKKLRNLAEKLSFFQRVEGANLFKLNSKSFAKDIVGVFAGNEWPRFVVAGAGLRGRLFELVDAARGGMRVSKRESGGEIIPCRG
jgi:hypothetical protein